MNSFFKKRDGSVCGLGFLSQNRGIGGCFEQGNETLVFTRSGEFLTISGTFNYFKRTMLHVDIYLFI